MEPVYSPVIAFAKSVFAFQGLKFSVAGEEHIPATGGAVIAINHTGYFDFAYAGLAALPHKRYIRFMCKDVIFDHKIAGPLMRGMKHIPVDRESGFGAFREAVKALKDGELVGVFPEATISRSFEIKTFKSGAVRMAQAAGVPIIPIVIWGSQRVWTKGHPKRLGRTNTPIRMAVGEPIVVPRGGDVEAANRELRDRMTSMLHELQDGYEKLSGADLKYVPARLGGTAPTPEEAAVVERADIAARRAAKGLPPLPDDADVTGLE